MVGSQQNWVCIHQDGMSPDTPDPAKCLAGAAIVSAEESEYLVPFAGLGSASFDVLLSG